MLKESFTMHVKYGEQIALLTDAQAGVLFRSLIAYQSEKDLPKMDEITKIVFIAIRQEIDSENQKNQMLSLVRKSAGGKGGRPSKSLENKGNKPKKPNAFFAFDNEKQEEKDLNKEKVTQKEKNKQKEEYTPLCVSPTTGEETHTFADKFFEIYPRYANDRAKMRADADYEKLIDEFSKSQYCRNFFTVKQINDNYPLIIAGDFRDKEGKTNDTISAIDAKVERERFYAERRHKVEMAVERVKAKLNSKLDWVKVTGALSQLNIDIAKAEAYCDNGADNLYGEKEYLEEQREILLAKYGFKAQDLLPKWHCDKCQDTGWRISDGKGCNCYKA